MAHTLTLELPQEVYERLIREAEEAGQPPEDVAVQWLVAASQNHGVDPLEELIGTLHSDVSDWAERHDHYLGLAALETHDESNPPARNG